MNSGPEEGVQMKTVVVLAMHGSPPRDFPKAQVALVVGLHIWLEHASGPLRTMIARYHAKLDTRIRTWPRTAENDLFYAAPQKLAAQLNQEAGCEVIVGYNEFCAPRLDEALGQAVTLRAEQVMSSRR
jgi:sirohydrochlorin cobaltochelatase